MTGNYIPAATGCLRRHSPTHHFNDFNVRLRNTATVSATSEMRYLIDVEILLLIWDAVLLLTRIIIHNAIKTVRLRYSALS